VPRHANHIGKRLRHHSQRLELALVFYVLNAIQDPNTRLIIGVLGLIYATIRSHFIDQTADMVPGGEWAR
jgi:hypothetical protein